MILPRHFPVLALIALPALAQTPEQTEFFEKKVRPVLATSCQACHNAKVKTAGLDVSSAEAFFQGGVSGPLIDSAHPGDSRLLKVISYEERLKMPPTGKLSAENLADLKAWVEMGSPWPGAEKPAAGIATRAKPQTLTQEERNFWAFQPLQTAAAPKVGGESWVRSPIDRFILAKLEEKGLKPAPPADKLTLLRRATYDLTGLPPTVTEIREFLADESPEAFRKVIDRLLASPRYGERWGRHWLDVARYADSTGNDEDHRYPYAWRYRDYVIDAFNQDLPYDQFIREQVAGDLLPAKDGGKLNRRGIVATGFLALGPKAIAQQDKTKMLYDVYDEQVDVLSKAFLGLTVACARCHDHKFDPILTRDYYSLISIFASTKSFKDSESHVSKLLYTPLVPQKEYEVYAAHQDLMSRKSLEIEDVADRELERYNQRVSPRLADYMLAARKVYKDGATAADAAAQAGLDPELLAKWMKYLKPDDKPRTFLDEWYNASPDQLTSTAQAYQARFQQRLGEWNETLETWRQRVRKMLKEMNMPPPPKPKFDSAKDPFFAEVYFSGGPFAVSQKEQEKIFSAEARTQLAALKAELKQLKENTPPEPDMACAVSEGEIVDQKVFIRGDYGSPGEPAPKGFPTVLARPNDPRVNGGSGRRELADWLARPQNPLTARVMVNRLWQWHFGEGLVRTPDNFGRTGERPTHPELLDWLAGEFIREGWSIKAMHRTMMLSSAYRMSSEISPKQFEADPENRLLSRFHRRRMDIEEIRDGMLAMDGTLDLAMGGTLQTGFGTDKENSNDRLSMNPEKIHRRLVYLPLRRANLPALLNLFDFGDATMPSGKRALTNVAPQALFMMNSEFVAERAKNLAKSLLDGGGPTDNERLETAYLRVLNRRPAAEELDSGLTYLAGFRKEFPDPASELDSWQSLCRILLASNEFIYVD